MILRTQLVDQVLRNGESVASTLDNTCSYFHQIKKTSANSRKVVNVGGGEKNSEDGKSAF